MGTSHCTLSPDFHVGGCCKQHDIDYETGGTEEDRYKADLKFYNCMKRRKFPLAIVYYTAVRLFGRSYFNKKNNTPVVLTAVEEYEESTNERRVSMRSLNEISRIVEDHKENVDKIKMVLQAALLAASDSLMDAKQFNDCLADSIVTAKASGINSNLLVTILTGMTLGGVEARKQAIIEEAKKNPLTPPSSFPLPRAEPSSFDASLPTGTSAQTVSSSPAGLPDFPEASAFADSAVTKTAEAAFKDSIVS